MYIIYLILNTMSIATLKKKTRAEYHTMSTNRPAFSINGTHRSQGWIGQNNMTPHFFDTLSLENIKIVKPSVMSNTGMIATKYRWIKRPAPFTSVKPDSNQNNNSQGAYLSYLQSKAIKNKKICDASNNIVDNLFTYKLGAMDQSQYLIIKDNTCIDYVYGPNQTTSGQPIINN